MSLNIFLLMYFAGNSGNVSTEIDVIICKIGIYRLLLYSKQTGVVNDNKFFEIKRGINEGDVLSGIFFNCVRGPAVILCKHTV